MIKLIKMAAGALIPTLLLAISSVQAQTVDVTCTGTETAHYSPPLTFTPKPTSFVATTNFSVCASLSDPNISSGVIEWEGSGDLSCVNGGSTGSAQIAWNTGETSDFDFETIVSQRPNGTVIILLDGEITAGKFVGGTMMQELTLLNLNLAACATTGVETLYGPVQMQIVTM